MSNMTVNAATACFPGYTPEDALEALAAGVVEPLMGRLSVARVQLCPQNHGVLTEDRLERLCLAYPDTQFRLHANVRTVRGQPRWTAADVGPASTAYFQEVGRLSQLIGAEAYTLHAGHRASASLEQLEKNRRTLEDLMGIPVGIEGMYPVRRSTWLIDSWAEYRWLLEAGARFAVDLSHLKIVATHERQVDEGLVAALLASPNCLEVHVSDNDGRRDTHHVPGKPVWWMPLLVAAVQENRNLVIFSEGNRLRSRTC